ncbi:MAG: histidinol-phosphatase HisJ family protein [Clostridiales bacterium]|nr:histidinol-phosphatase HisJ family protein [Clostridiales bacterium]
MKYDNFYDLHTHSQHSFDGHNSCFKMCESAYQLGLKGIALTDHCEIDAKNYDFDKFCNNQFNDVSQVAESFKNKLKVFKGIELGQAVYNTELAEKILNTYDYDFVLGSIHNLRNMEDFFFLDYSAYNVYELLEKYFDTIKELCVWDKFDSLAHLTYPLRYITGKYKINVDLNKFSDKIDEILSILVKNGKALEINTSGYFNELKDILPGADIVKRFKELGGVYITLGSDSHFYDKIGCGIEQGMDAAKQCGFDCITIYEKRNPILLPIK